MPKPIIVLALPTARPLVGGKLPHRIMRFGQALNELMPEYEVLVSHSACPREAHAVNLLIEEFRNNPRAQWFVWWNPTLELTPEQLRTLLTSGRAVAGALYTNLDEPEQWEASFYPDLLPDEKGIFPVPELGGGAKVYHRSAFDLIEKADPSLTYIYDNSGRSCVAFCQETVGIFGDYRRLLSPAYHLDFLCRKHGVGIFAHADVVVRRRGTDGVLHPRKEPYRPWLFKREPPPVCAEELAEGERDARPIAIYIQYCDKDEEQANRLHDRISEEWNIPCGMQMSFGDKYPKGPNETAIGIMKMDFSKSNYKAVLLIEPDCCPLTPDWLDQLSADWDKAQAAGKLIMGSWHPINADHPALGHLNGNLMFAPDLAQRITIPDVPDDKPWDTYLADVFAPVWCRTGLIKNLNRHKTATTKMLTTPECGTKPPVLIHGVKDDSAWQYAAQNDTPKKTG